MPSLFDSARHNGELAYRRLLDLYYTQEGHLSQTNPNGLPIASGWIPRAIIGFVLREFFTLEGTGDRCFVASKTVRQGDREVPEKGRCRSENGAQHVGGNRNGEPKSDAQWVTTNNQRTKNHRNTPLPPEGVKAFDEFWNKYPRKVGKPKALIAYAAAV
jgi:hypothetical protein